ncbi:MAG: hypothetical protein DI538_16085 [Azospira oryzae]|nr:MAG: hypothetical protein DI538_16085 [Azospira oryzae]
MKRVAGAGECGGIALFFSRAEFYGLDNCPEGLAGGWPQTEAGIPSPPKGKIIKALRLNQKSQNPFI